MIAKIWQKLGLIILIIACLFNITLKIVKKVSINQELESSANYEKSIEKTENEI